ncbi:MAG: hypothetical protein Q9210_002766 [Variospora velana]
MARPKKNQEQKTLKVGIEDFVRTRDSVSCIYYMCFHLFGRDHSTLKQSRVRHHSEASPSSSFALGSTRMAYTSRHLTAIEVLDALRSLELLNLPLCNVCEIARQLACDICESATHPFQAHLTYASKVVTGLATLQSAVQDLSRAYIAHTNTVIGKGAGPSLELLNFATPLGGESGLFNAGRLATPAPAPEQGEGKKKRKRAPHDKNAPKRPVTPYFLYMSFARDGIAKSMGSGTSAKQVADEGTRRWNTMKDEEKQACFDALPLWQEKYGANYAAYKEKVKAYKAGLPIPEFTPDEIQQLYDEQRGGKGAVISLQEAHSDNNENSDSEGDEESDATSSQEPSPEPPKAVSPPKSPRISKRGKVVKGKAEKKATPVKATSPNLQHSLKSPDTGNKKNKTAKKRGARAIDDVSEPKKELQEEVGNSPAKSKMESEPKQKRKKRRSEAADA